jgi:site-specific DNA-cytosine methylase
MSDWKIPATGSFSGIIGGPPCQPFSIATGSNESTHADQIGEFWRICNYLKPDFAIMEEVVDAGVLNHPDIPADVRVAILRDWDCGGNTERVRGFWHRGCSIVPPATRDGKGEWSVLARSWDKVVSDGPKARVCMHSNLSARRACELQGFPEFMEHIQDERRVIPEKLIVHMMGNGVPRAMGEWVVRAVLGMPQPTLQGQTFSLNLEAA